MRRSVVASGALGLFIAWTLGGCVPGGGGGGGSAPADGDAEIGDAEVGDGGVLAGGRDGEPGAAPCVEGRTEVRACGPDDSGQQARRCADERWTAWGDCEVADGCVDGVRQTDPVGCEGDARRERRCEDGAWGAWSACAVEPECADDAVEQSACGPNGGGLQVRVCAEGRWSPWGECAGAGECREGSVEVRACGADDRGEERRACVHGAWGDWGPCEGAGACLDGSTETRACGPNGGGVEARTCVEGAWGGWGACEGADACRDGEMEREDCGLNGRGTAMRTCAEGAWPAFGACEDPDVCVDGRDEARPCDGGGAQRRQCAAGAWTDWGACEGGGDCEAGTLQERGCGLNGRGFERRDCQDGRWGAWGACDDPDACVDGVSERRACDSGDDQRRTCALGRWGEWSACVLERASCDRPDQTVELGAGGSASLRLDSRGRADAARPVACAGGGAGAETIIALEVQARATVTFEIVEADFDAVLYLRAACDEPDSEIACADGEPARLEQDLQPGRYHLVVDGRGADDRGIATLDIAVAEAEGCAPDDAQCLACIDRFEPNDAPGLAAGVPDGELRDLTLCPAEDPHDYYRYRLRAPGLVTATASVPAGGVALRIEDPVRGPLPASSSAGPGQVSTESYVPEAGDWLVHAFTTGGDAPVRDYDLTVTFEESLDCGWRDRPLCVRCGDDDQPNDVPAQAEPIAVDGVKFATVCQDVDPVDVYRFELDAATDVRVHLTRLNHLGSSTHIVLSADGGLPQLAGGGMGLASWWEGVLPAGSYRVTVRADTGQLEYILSVQRR